MCIMPNANKSGGILKKSLKISNVKLSLFLVLWAYLINKLNSEHVCVLSFSSSAYSLSCSRSSTILTIFCTSYSVSSQIILIIEQIISDHLLCTYFLIAIQEMRMNPGKHGDQ